MKEKRLNCRALHDPRKPRDLKILTTKSKKVEPRWVRKNEPNCYCAHVSPVDATRSNRLGISSGTCLSS